MGGHALSVESVRLSAVNYFTVAEVVSEVLTSKAPDLKFSIIPAYFQKPDFGDMDILFSSEGFDPYRVAEVLKATEVVRNGDVTSIGFQIGKAIFQLDLISTPKECFDFSLSYFGFFANCISALVLRLIILPTIQPLLRYASRSLTGICKLTPSFLIWRFL